MKAHTTIKMLSIMLATYALSACLESSEDSDFPNPNPPNAFFIDSNVQGLNYASPSYSGVTGVNGSFPYATGEITTFSLYGMTIGSASPTSNNPVVTPANLLGEARSAAEMQTLLEDRGTNNTAQAITNLLVLLQSFDDDGQAENGIYIREASSPFSEDDYRNHLQSLDLNSTSFRNDAETLLQNHSQYTQRNLVAEADAIDHFINSLKNLETVTDYVGRWVMRSGSHGDVSAVYNFSDSSAVNLTEYENCPDNLWGSTEGLLKANCFAVNIEQNFSSNGASISFINADLTDTCVPLSINSHEAALACDFFGSGLGTEVIRLQRAPTNFSEAPLIGTYRDLNAGSAVGSFTISDDTNGSYQPSGEASQAFNWTNTASELTVNPTSSSDGPATLVFKGFIKGSWLLSEDSTDVNVILNNTDNTINANLLKMDGFFGIFDATPTALESSGSGQCKGVARIVDDNGIIKINSYDNASGNTYSCDYPRDWDSQTPASSNVQFSSNAMTILGNSEDLDCYLLGIDTSDLNSYYVVCEKPGAESFDIEIWKPL